MRRPILLTALAIAGSAQAQAAPATRSEGLAVQAGLQQQALPPGPDITFGAALAAGDTSGSASYDYSPGWNDTAVDLVFDVACEAFVQTSTSTSGSTRHEVWSARPITGRFVVTWTADLEGTGAASFLLDLLDDGSTDATGSVVIPFALPAGMTPLRVDLAASANAGVAIGAWGIRYPYDGTAHGRLSIRFESTDCSAQPYGAACSAVTLEAAPNLLGAATLTAQCAPGTDVAIAVLGFDQLSTTLPAPPGCALLTTPAVLLWLPGENGQAAWTLQKPVGLGSVSFAAQAVALTADPLRAEASAGLWISCR